MTVTEIINKIKNNWFNANVKDYVFSLLYARKYNLNSLSDKIVELRKDPEIYELLPDFESVSIGKTREDRVKKLEELDAWVGEIELKEIGVFCDLLINTFQDTGAKSAGQFFTPYEACELIASIGLHNKPVISQVFDPTCGNGNLLQVVNNKNDKIDLFGSEINLSMVLAAKARFSLNENAKNIIKYMDFFEFKKENPNQQFQLILGNPPFSSGVKGTRWDNVYNKKCPDDWAFILESLDLLDSKGYLVMCLPMGVLYRNDGKKIRQALKPYVDTIINFPKNMFYNTMIATCCIVFSKEGGIDKCFCIDASKEWAYTQKDKVNVLNHKKVFEIYKNKEEIEGQTKYIELGDEWNFYLEKEEAEEVIDPRALMNEINRLHAESDEHIKKLNELVAMLEGW